MTFALGSLGWKPDDFWNATFYEMSCAYAGYCKENGVGMDAPWTDEDQANFEDMKRRFPDTPPAEVN
jgi:hypothetical protein